MFSVSGGFFLRRECPSCAGCWFPRQDTSSFAHPVWETIPLVSKAIQMSVGNSKAPRENITMCCKFFKASVSFK